MSDQLKKGDHVEWDTAQGKTQGTVTKKVTDTATAKGHTAKASKDDPQFEVKSDKSGKTAIHTPEELNKTSHNAGNT